MIIGLYIVCFVCGVILALLLYMFKRNGDVYNFRTRMSNEEAKYLINRHIPSLSFKRYDGMPKYDEMLWKFWIPLKKYEKPLADYYEDEINEDSRIREIKDSNIGIG